MKFQVSRSVFPPILVLQEDGATPPVGTTLIGTFDHDQPVDEEYGWLGNHKIQHHIRDVAYKAGTQDMGRYDIVDLTDRTVSGVWRDFFVSLDNSGDLATVTDTPMVGTIVRSISTPEAGRLKMTLAGDMVALIQKTELRINTQRMVRLAVAMAGNDTVVDFAIPPLLIKPYQVVYMRFRDMK